MTNAYLCIDSWAGRIEYPVTVVRETPKRYVVKLNGGECLPSRRIGQRNQEIKVPKTAIRWREGAAVIHTELGAELNA